ncbi:MAG: hypothetical protein IKM31_00600 [Oscillospiraceae bacterium]|nr:hypothetical protein [Oscillospiraceae bacterium]
MDKDKLKAFFSGLSDKKSRILLFLGIGGMLLIFLSGLLPEKEEALPEDTARTAAAYAEDISARLTEFIGCIHGAGETKVLVFTENNGENRYLKAERVDQTKDALGSGSASRAEDYVLTDGKDGRSAVLVSFYEPGIRGVAVICEGGDDPDVRARVTETVTTLLHISSARVSVSRMAKQ